MYAVFSSYCKHGMVDLMIIESDQEMMDYCLEQLAEYHKEFIETYLETEMPVNSLYRSQHTNQDRLNVIYQMYQGRALDEVINATIKGGNQYVEDEAGLGVRYIVRGDNLVPLGNYGFSPYAEDPAGVGY